MSQFEVLFLKKVDKQLNQIHPNDKKKAIEFFRKLISSFYPQSADIAKMTGTEDTYRAKIGKLRIIYTVLKDANRIVITKVKYRKSVYRN